MFFHCSIENFIPFFSKCLKCSKLGTLTEQVSPAIAVASKVRQLDFWKKLFPGNCSNTHSSVWWCQRSHPFKYSVAALGWVIAVGQLSCVTCFLWFARASKDDTQEPPEAIAALPGHDWFLEMHTIGIQRNDPKKQKQNTPGDFWKYLYNKS